MNEQAAAPQQADPNTTFLGPISVESITAQLKRQLAPESTDVPAFTGLIITGPKGAGKTQLVNALSVHLNVNGHTAFVINDAVLKSTQYFKLTVSRIREQRTADQWKLAGLLATMALASGYLPVIDMELPAPFAWNSFLTSFDGGTPPVIVDLQLTATAEGYTPSCPAVSSWIQDFGSSIIELLTPQADWEAKSPGGDATRERFFQINKQFESLGLKLFPGVTFGTEEDPDLEQSEDVQLSEETNPTAVDDGRVTPRPTPHKRQPNASTLAAVKEAASIGLKRGPLKKKPQPTPKSKKTSGK